MWLAAAASHRPRDVGNDLLDLIPGNPRQGRVGMDIVGIRNDSNRQRPGAAAFPRRLVNAYRIAKCGAPSILGQRGNRGGRTELQPTKLELLEEWLPRQPWFPEPGTSGLSKVGSYRFDDPAGEVGIETIIVSAGGSTVQVPLTYRAQPLAGAESWLVGTMQHSVLGQRWVYDACADPIYVTALAASIMLGQPQAKQYLDVKGKLETLAESVFVQSTGPKLSAVPTVSSATPRDTEDGTVIETADLHLLVVRRLDLEGQPVGPLTLTGIWEGQQESVRLAAVTKA